MENIYYNSQQLPEIQPTLDKIPHDQGCILLLRHSLRPPMTHQFGAQIHLTEDGKKLAEQFGSPFSVSLTNIESSSSVRCIQTAEAIIKGTKNEQLAVKINPYLGEPGAYVENKEEAQNTIKNIDPMSAINGLLQEVEMQGIRNIHTGNKLLLDSFFTQKIEPGCLHIHVTHDTIISALIYSLIGVTELDSSMWPKMLEGALLWLDNVGKLNWVWRGKQYSRPF